MTGVICLFPIVFPNEQLFPFNQKLSVSLLPNTSNFLKIALFSFFYVLDFLCLT